MALQPSPRPAGSTQVLRFSGSITVGAQTTAQYPKNNAEIPAGFVPAPGTFVGIRFELADSTDPTDPTTTLPNFVYDDSVPAAVSPAAPTTGVVVANQINATDQLITDRTWCENTYITVEPRTAAAAALLTAIDHANVQFMIDATNSGLGGNAVPALPPSGKPVLMLPVELSALPVQNELEVDILVEVRHSASR